MKTIKKFLYLLSFQERKRAYLLFGMILVMALLDILGIASILPFITVLSNPELIENNYILKTMFETLSDFGVKTSQQFLFILGSVVFLLLVASLTFKAITIYMQTRFTAMCEYSISKRLMENYLHQPYSWFLNRHSADIGKNILSEVSKVVGKGLGPMINIIAQSTVTFAIITLLILVDPKISILVFLILGTAYGLIYKLTRNYITLKGKQSIKYNEWRFTAISDAFGAVKEIKVGGLEEVYIKRYSDPAKILARDNALVTVISQLPRFALEIITFGGMLLVLLYLMSKSGTFISALPIIALYAFAGYRLMPALQQIFNSGVQLRFTVPALNNLYYDLKSLKSHRATESQDTLLLSNNITLSHIHYKYPNASLTALKDISFSIRAFSTVGIVGTTGSGKTTTVDMILGLLEAQQGTLEVDGKQINYKNRRAWQRSVGYVPQKIFLTDDTIAANIAFGLDPKEINLEAVEHASKVANLHDFVVDELPLKYQTTVGENGIRLSGGQRQRIGIARALYHNPQLLIFDEATSALDNLTEQAVMEAVHKLRKNITIILIAHRLSTVKKCDNILLLEKGELKAQGTFEKLIEASDRFRSTAKNL